MAKGYDNEDQAAEAALREAERLRKAAEAPPGNREWERPRGKGKPGSRFFPDEQEESAGEGQGSGAVGAKD